MPYFPILQKPTQNNLITKTSFRQDAPSPWRKNRRREDCPIGAIHRHRRKTAEERFHTLARGWLAYPVTPMHARLPPKSGCINVIPRFALSRRRATALFRNPVCKAQRSVPGFSSTPTSACRRYATSPPSAVASHIIRHPSDCPIVRHHHRIAPTAQYTAIGEKTAEERFNMLARGWLAYPVTPTHALLPPKSGCRSPWRAKKRPMVGIPTIGLCIATFCCAITC